MAGCFHPRNFRRFFGGNHGNCNPAIIAMRIRYSHVWVASHLWDGVTRLVSRTTPSSCIRRSALGYDFRGGLLPVNGGCARVPPRFHPCATRSDLDGKKWWMWLVNILAIVFLDVSCHFLIVMVGKVVCQLCWDAGSTVPPLLNPSSVAIKSRQRPRWNRPEKERPQNAALQWFEFLATQRWKEVRSDGKTA